MSTAIQKHLGDFDLIVDLQGRIQSTWKSLFPGAAILTDEEAFSLAQVANMQGLDPFNKEIYYLKQEKNGVMKSLGCMPGIRGLRKHAHRQIRYEGGRSANFWIEFQQILDKNEKARIGAGDNDLVVCAQLRDSVTMQNYLAMRKEIFGNHSSWTDLLKLVREDGDAVAKVQIAIESQAKEILGAPPIITSYGIVKNFELKKDGQKLVLPLQMSSGQNPLYMAEIRAERRALYKRFDLEKQFGAIVEEVGLVEELDAIVDAQEEQTPDTTPEQPRSREQNLRELGVE